MCAVHIDNHIELCGCVDGWGGGFGITDDRYSRTEPRDRLISLEAWSLPR